jgi:hypothetical protein
MRLSSVVFGLLAAGPLASGYSLGAPVELSKRYTVSSMKSLL